MVKKSRCQYVNHTLLLQNSVTIDDIKTMVNEERKKYICKNRPVLITGDCSYCKKKYCNKHRLPEDHQCTDMASCKEESFNKNKSKLLDGKCIKPKLVV